MLEADFIAILCAFFLQGAAEVSHDYTVGGETRRIRVDCETAEGVTEIGLDRRSSLDSVQQALFSATLTGKAPAVILVDTDGVEGAYELRIRTAAAAAGVAYSAYSADFLIRWRMTAYLRCLTISDRVGRPIE